MVRIVKLERKKNSIRNIKFGFFNKIVTILFPFLMRTVIIYTMGSEYLGLSSLFTSILQVLSLSELGIGSAMVFELYKPIVENDIKKICKLQNLYKKIYFIIGIVIIIIGLCLLPFLDNFIRGSYPEDVNIYILYILYLINSSVSYLLFSYKASLLTAHQRRDIILNIGTIIHISLYLIQIFCLINFKNYYAYIIWLPIFTILENIIIAIYVKKMYPNYIPLGKLEKSEVKTIFIRVKDLFGHKLSSVVTNSVDTIVISSFLGLNMVTIYNNYYYLMSAISGVLDIIYQGILAGIGNSLISENKQKNIKDFYKFFFLNAWIVGWCTICFLCLYQPMIELWMGKDLMLSFSSVILLSLYFYIWKIRQTVLVYKDAAGMWNIDNKKPYVEIAFNLIINIILVNIIGINGVIISTILSMLLISFPWENKAFFKQCFNENTKQYYKKFSLYTIITILGCILTYFICSLVHVSGILNFIIKIIICIIVPNLIMFIVCIKSGKFKEIVNIVKKEKKYEI